MGTIISFRSIHGSASILSTFNSLASHNTPRHSKKELPSLHEEGNLVIPYRWNDLNTPSATWQTIVAPDALWIIWVSSPPNKFDGRSFCHPRADTWKGIETHAQKSTSWCRFYSVPTTVDFSTQPGEGVPIG